MKTILVADDEKNILRIITFNLKKKGYQVITAENGEDAFEKILEKKPDLAILDIMMPRFNGYEVCQKIKEEGIKLSIILLSAKGQKNDIERGSECGADIYLTKPFSPRILIEEIEKLLGRDE
ncbi:MAG: response regulator transcription factor [Candidatus Muiribacteriaceae bacterium]